MAQAIILVIIVLVVYIVQPVDSGLVCNRTRRCADVFVLNIHMGRATGRGGNGDIASPRLDGFLRRHGSGRHWGGTWSVSEIGF